MLNKQALMIAVDTYSDESEEGVNLKAMEAAIKAYKAVEDAQGETIQTPLVCIEEGEQKIQTEQPKPSDADDRAAFEACCEEDLTRNEYHYYCEKTQDLLVGWQAAREYYAIQWKLVAAGKAPDGEALLVYPSLHETVTVGHCQAGEWWDALDENAEIQPIYWDFMPSKPTQQAGEGISI